jgi:flagellar basal-body rod protein FlgG
MVSGIYQLVDGSLIQQLRFDAISNNLANSNTSGFKKDIISFDQALSMQKTATVDFSAGAIVFTENPFDIALDGMGFFKVQTSEGVRYTRDGSFGLNSDGYLVNQKGDMVLGENGPIRLNGTDFVVNREGQISEDGVDTDKIDIVNFSDLNLLKKEGLTYYVYRGDQQDIQSAEDINVQQQHLEKSNVNPTEEMIAMIEAFRAFESVQKAIQNMDEITSEIVNDSELF